MSLCQFKSYEQIIFHVENTIIREFTTAELFINVTEVSERLLIYERVRYFPSYRGNHLIPGSSTTQRRCTSVMIGTISVTAAFPLSSRYSEKFSQPSFCGNREAFTIAQICHDNFATSFILFAYFCFLLYT
jgi:hypothetical protein